MKERRRDEEPEPMRSRPNDPASGGLAAPRPFLHPIPSDCPAIAPGFPWRPVMTDCPPSTRSRFLRLPIATESTRTQTLDAEIRRRKQDRPVRSPRCRRNHHRHRPLRRLRRQRPDRGYRGRAGETAGFRPAGRDRTRRFGAAPRSNDIAAIAMPSRRWPMVSSADPWRLGEQRRRLWRIHLRRRRTDHHARLQRAAHGIRIFPHVF